MERTVKTEELSTQVKRRLNRETKEMDGIDGDFTNTISSGSTLLDLAISGGRKRGGGVPGGILVEAFGPSGAGKTVLLCEFAGDVQRKGGETKFRDPEARLNKQFALQFGLKIRDKEYSRPSEVPEIFEDIPVWKPKNPQAINGLFADSLAALSTDMEMNSKGGDKMGGRRAKEFSECLRKSCRILAEKNYIMICSNQVRENMNAMAFEEKYKTPGGVAIGFYSSLRLRFYNPIKIVKKKEIHGTDTSRIIGVTTKIEVYKSSIWKPYRSADVSILFDYGIDDIRENLKYIKNYSGKAVYTLGGRQLDKSLDKSIRLIEHDNLQLQLKEEVMDLWEEVESNFETKRKKVR
jgi:recombination protein RecA